MCLLLLFLLQGHGPNQAATGHFESSRAHILRPCSAFCLKPWLESEGIYMSACLGVCCLNSRHLFLLFCSASCARLTCLLHHRLCSAASSATCSSAALRLRQEKSIVACIGMTLSVTSCRDAWEACTGPGHSPQTSCPG